MNFTEVVAEVIAASSRPDKIADIRRYVNGAINFCCVSSNFARDLEETTVAISPTVYSQSFAISELTRFRKICWMRLEGSTKFIEPLDISSVDKTKRDWCDRYYMAGGNIMIKTSALGDTLELGYYQYPAVLTDASPDFWLLDISPYMIIDKASARLFKDIGDNDSADRCEGEFRTAFLAAQADYTYGVNKGR